MDLKNLIVSVDILLLLQCTFNKFISDKIFKDDSNQLYPKWEQSNGNILNFITKLDDNNKNKLLEWVRNV